ncbi:uncharacterized protein BP01DRAFT_389173 [Aspergillus saccharolyticus JOP 1030-1]|uniref:Histidine-specific methyltransferase SAM-dependent domain-containing protein n=1 Tax=Aspergillus saccharolyticus JOP 1030-1 TaxID=1450539 RepID=A0A318ZLT7_9EURO|nr:hypothetical protein BP01DRAFT_389173 [Aspergillus saccharolyticus JOP 1030-1]PYH48571.1 hypothetical protein BP01DRAFT_389173 [Aspergillus saccharolyticus JOP 1030-1]
MATICETIQPSPAFLLDKHSSKDPVLQDIRKSMELLDLKSGVLSGLLQSQKSVPSLLLWDEKGLKRFNEWTECPHYYPKSKESEILEANKHRMAEALPSKTVLIELGCGNLHKTLIILSALATQGKEVQYYAVDVSESALRTSLRALQAEMNCFPTIRISGLIGTYDDCVDWITNNPATAHAPSVTFLWVGNSVANLSKAEASNLMGSFRQACCTAGIQCRFLVSADACTDASKLIKAYNPRFGPSCSFLRHGIQHVNRLFGMSLFEDAIWDCTIEYDRQASEILAFYSPKVDVAWALDSGPVTVHQGEMIFFFRSGKWNEEQMGNIARQSGFQVSQVWKDSQEEYGFYLLSS